MTSTFLGAIVQSMIGHKTFQRDRRYLMKNANYFEYKGYHTRIEFDYDSLTLLGKIEGIDDLILFENEDATKIEEEFHKAVDNYLLLCEEVGKITKKI